MRMRAFISRSVQLSGSRVFAVLSTLAVLLSCQLAFADLLVRNQTTNSTFHAEFPYIAANQGIYVGLGEVTAVKFLADPAPSVFPDGPSVIVTDATVGRLVWRAYDTAASKYGYKGFSSGFSMPHSLVATSAGSVFVSDTGNNRVVRLSYSANSLAFSSVLAGGNLYRPMQVALDRHGAVYVADSGNGRIRKYDQSGNPINSFMGTDILTPHVPTNAMGACGSADGQLMGPIGVAVDYLDDSIYVVDMAGQRIQKFSPSGAFVKSVAQGSGGIVSPPNFVSIDSDLLGRVIATDGRNGILYVMDSGLNVLSANRGDSASPFIGLRGVAVDKSQHTASGPFVSLANVYTTENWRLSQFSFDDKLTADSVQGHAVLNWNYDSLPQGAAASYQIERATAQNGPYSLIATVPGTSASYTDTPPGAQTYFYRVSIVTAQGDTSSRIGPVSVSVVNTPPPTAPQGLDATEMAGGIILQWLLPPTATSIDVFRRSGTGSFVEIAHLFGTNIFSYYNYFDNAVQPGVLYTYEIRARDSNNQPGPFSNLTRAAATPESTWPQYQHDVFHQGENGADSIGPRVARRWGTVAGNGAGVVIGESKVFRADLGTLTIQDLETGNVIWSYSPGFKGSQFTGNILNWPVVSRGIVYYTDGANVYGIIEASSTPGPLWTYTPPKPSLGSLPSPSAITAFNYGVILSGNLVYTTLFGTAYALDWYFGTLKWSAVVANGLNEIVAPPAVSTDGGMVYFVSNRGRVSAFNTATYNPVAKTPDVAFLTNVDPGTDQITGSPTVANGLLIIPAGSHVFALDAKTGVPVWTFSRNNLVVTGAVAVLGNQAFMINDLDASILCVSLVDGSLVWTKKVTDFDSTIASAVSHSSPALVGNTLFYTVLATIAGTTSSNTVRQGRLVGVALTPGSPVPPTVGYFAKEDIGVTTQTPAIAKDRVVVGTVAYGPPQPTSIRFSAPRAVVRGAPFNLCVEVVDDFGQVYPFTGIIDLTSSDTTGQVPTPLTLPGSACGTAKFNKAGQQTISATVRGQPGITGTATFVVKPSTGRVASLSVTTPAAVEAGATFGFTVTALDAYNNVVTGFGGTVTFTSSDLNAVLPAPYPFTSTDAGVHFFPSATLYTVGSQTLTATDPRSGATGTATIEVFPAPTFVEIPGARLLEDIDFYGALNGWIVGSFVADAQAPLVLGLSGGVWSPVSVQPLPACTIFVDATGVSVNSPTTGWMEVQGIPCEDNQIDGYLYKQSVGTWQSQQQVPAPGFPYPQAVALTDANDGWLTTSGCYYCSDYLNQVTLSRYDGTNWNPVPLPAGIILGGFRFVRGQPQEGWAFAYGAPTGLYRFRNNAWEADTTYTLPQGLLCMWMNSPTDVWGGGFGQYLVHFDGSAWTQVANPAPYGASFFAMHFWDANHGLVVGASTGGYNIGTPNIMYYINGTWQNLPVVLPSNLVNLGMTGVRMVSPTEAWAYGAGFDIQSGNLDQPVVVHIFLPDPPAATALASAAAAPGPGTLVVAPQSTASSAPSLPSQGRLRIEEFTFSRTGPSRCRDPDRRQCALFSHRDDLLADHARCLLRQLRSRRISLCILLVGR